MTTTVTNRVIEGAAIRCVSGYVVEPIDMAINPGAVVSLLVERRCIVTDGVVATRDDYEDQREYGRDLDEFRGALAAAELAAYDAAADEIVSILGEAPAPDLDYRTLSPCSQAIGNRFANTITINEATNWGGGVGRMCAALSLIQQHAAAALAPIEREAQKIVDATLAANPGSRHHTRAWQDTLHSAHSLVEAAAKACVAHQLARVETTLSNLSARVIRDFGEIIGVEVN